MSLPHRSKRPQGGFTLIELMVGMFIGLLSTLAIAGVVYYSESSKRTSTNGSDAQVVGALSLYSLQREIESAGYGLVAVPASLGCPISAQFKGAAVAGFPAAVEPVKITRGKGSIDTVRVLGTELETDPAKRPNMGQGYAVPMRLVAPAYNPAMRDAGGAAYSFNVEANVGVATGDLVMAMAADGSSCEVFKVTGLASGVVQRADDSAGWNSPNFPSHSYVADDVLINLGKLHDVTITVSADGRLQLTRYDTATQSNAAALDLQSNVVALRAFYGKDTDNDGAVDIYDTTTPATNADWAQVRSVRVAVLVRSAQFEKDAIFSADSVDWDVGNAVKVDGSHGCKPNGADSQCISLDVSGVPDYTHYRYKLHDTVIPLRNMVWNAEGKTYVVKGG